MSSTISEAHKEHNGTGDSSSLLPAFKDLPLKPEYPPHAAWGVWGDEDELGTVNNITPETILAASKEIKQGVRVTLDWGVDQPKYPFYNRTEYRHEIVPILPSRSAIDDIIHLNTQSSSQWDSLRHFGYGAEHIFYNGVKQDEVLADKSFSRNGIQNLARAGIAGRGVLLDFYRYALKHNIKYDPYTQYGVTLEQLEAIRVDQGIEFRKGDILLIRFGHIAVYDTLTDDRKKEIAKFPHTWAGVGQSKDVLEWIWDNHFAAVGGDAPAFETTPSLADFRLHPVILSGFGCPIGELFDLEKLSVQCETSNRWSFFLTSTPLNIPGGVASPPNAMAIF